MASVDHLELQAKLLQRVDGVLSHSMGSNLLPAKAGEDGPSWHVDGWWMFLALPLLILSSFVAAMRAPAPNEIWWKLSWLQVWCWVFLVLATGLAFVTKRAIRRLLVELVPRLSQATLVEAEQGLARGYGPSRKRWTAALITFSYLTLTVSALLRDLTWRTPWPFWCWLIVFGVVFWVAINVGYACTFYGVLASSYSQADLAWMPWTPALAPAVTLTLAIATRILWFMLFTTVYLATLLLEFTDFKYFLSANVAACTLYSLGLGLAVYAVVHRRLTTLVEFQRARSLERVQCDLSRFVPPNAPGDYKRIGALLELLRLVREGPRTTSFLAPLQAVLPVLVNIATFVRASTKAH